MSDPARFVALHLRLCEVASCTNLESSRFRMEVKLFDGKHDASAVCHEKTALNPYVAGHVAAAAAGLAALRSARASLVV